MESVFDQECQEQGNLRSDCWTLSNLTLDGTEDNGSFYEQMEDNSERYQKYYINDHFLCCRVGSQLYSLQLLFTKIEEKLHLKNHKRVYGIKLYRKKQAVELFTYDQQIFIRFFTLLSKICILTNFEEHYKVKNRIGSGSFSIVYQGQNLFERRIVALKAYSKEQMKKKQHGIQLVKNQILNLHRLKQHNISPLIETYETVDRIILVQHKANSGDMLQYLKLQQNNINEQMVKKIIKKILERIKLLHEIGYIHRDLKPENILFFSANPDSNLLLSDLGLTVEKQNLKNKKIKHYSCGTLGFVAPQILNYVEGQHEYNERCDLFSIGCIFYFLCTGRSLFESRSIKQKYMLNKTCKNMDSKILQLNGLSPEGLHLMTGLLEKDHNKRINAQEACNHPYFGNVTDKTTLNFEETTNEIKLFLTAKIKKYWSSYQTEIY